MTAVVHLVSAFTAGCLSWRKADKRLVVSFGVPAVVGSFIGAGILVGVASQSLQYSLTVFGTVRSVDLVKGLIGALIVGFAVVEALSSKRLRDLSPKGAPAWGLITGVFGGLSGHQGALRAGFLSAMRLQPEVFVGTQSLIAVMVDVSRLVIYGMGFLLVSPWTRPAILLGGIAGGVLGSLLGKAFLRSLHSTLLQLLVMVALILFGSGMMLGFL